MGIASFMTEALVDFPDDALTCARPLTAEDIDALMATLRSLGVRRVSWGYYGDGHGGWVHPDYAAEYGGGWLRCAATYREIGDPLRVAVAAGHRHGLEVYAYFKPYETGVGAAFPTGSPEARRSGLLHCIGGKLAWMEPFVLRHPELRIQRRTDDVPPGNGTATIATIRLRKRDASPTRITKERLRIWASEDNYRYQPLTVDFELRESVEPAPRESRDVHGRLLTRAGDPVRTLTLSGLRLDHRYVLVTTDFTDGDGDFVNSGLELMSAYDERDREILGVFALGGAIWMADLVDFRNGGLMFDDGFGSSLCTLDAPNASGRRGCIAFARGRNAYLPGALCETEPAVQRFWLDCLDEMITAGVDGVDIRDENHSTHTDTPEDYGFNPAVLARCAGGTGDIRQRVARVRGEAYTSFLAACKRRLGEAGKRMRYHLQLDWLRPDPPRERGLAYPANLHLD
jgi:hypothetical protein